MLKFSDFETAVNFQKLHDKTLIIFSTGEDMTENREEITLDGENLYLYSPNNLPLNTTIYIVVAFVADGHIGEWSKGSFVSSSAYIEDFVDSQIIIGEDGSIGQNFPISISSLPNVVGTENPIDRVTIKIKNASTGGQIGGDIVLTDMENLNTNTPDVEPNTTYNIEVYAEVTADNLVSSTYVKSATANESFMPIFDIFGDGSRIALYTFDGNTEDYGGLNNATWNELEKYNDAKSVVFDGGTMGTNTYNNGIHLNGSVCRDKDVFAISVFFKPNDDNNSIIIESDYYDDTVNSYATGWAITSNFIIKSLSSSVVKKLVFEPLEVGAYNHLVVNFNHLGNVEIYVNGSLVADGDISGAKYYNGRHYANTGENIGASYSGQCFGEMRFFSVFNRFLTTAEISKLQKEGR
jgi:hypothetical protein